jgi:hypothetical protein
MSNQLYVGECVVILNLKAAKCCIMHLNEFIWIIVYTEIGFHVSVNNENSQRFKIFLVYIGQMYFSDSFITSI